MLLNIAEEYTNTPGGRLKENGPCSGEEFREVLLIPKYLEALESNTKLYINLDGGYGYPVCFLEEAFGGLGRQYDQKKVLKTLIFISNDDPDLISKIANYIEQK